MAKKLVTMNVPNLHMQIIKAGISLEYKFHKIA